MFYFEASRLSRFYFHLLSLPTSLFVTCFRYDIKQILDICLYSVVAKTMKDETIESNKNALIQFNKYTNIIHNQVDGFLTQMSVNPDILSFVDDWKGNNLLEVGRINNEKVLISYETSDVYSWKYIRMTPYSDVIGNINVVKNYAVFVSPLAIVIGIIASLLFSKNIRLRKRSGEEKREPRKNHDLSYAYFEEQLFDKRIAGGDLR